VLERWARLRALPASDRRLLLQATFLVAAARVATLVLPYQRIAALTASRTARSHLAPAAIDQLAWAVTAAGRAVPGGNCLPQALALQVLLKRRGEPASLRLGVARDEQGGLHAHAWVDCQDRTVIGGDVAHMAPLLPSVRARD